MTAYLLTWNPKNWDWESSAGRHRTYEAIVHATEAGEAVADRWSVGKRRLLELGADFYLMRVHEPPKGIIGHGRVESSNSWEDTHWDREKAEQGEKALYAAITFDRLVPWTDCLPLDVLEATFPDQLWTPQSSGNNIKAELLPGLEALWRNHTAHLEQWGVPWEEGGYQEGALTRVLVNRYERSSRARQVCVAAKGFACSVCQFSFEATYGARGRDFIHVHHTLPVSDIGKAYQVDPIKHLEPICPNCHAMIHRGRELLSIEELREIVHQRRHVD